MQLKNINSINGLRDHALETLQKLSEGQIEVAQAGVTGKLCESVMSTIKAELEYARMLGKEPNIPFMGNLSKNKRLAIQSEGRLNLEDKG